MTPIGSLIAQGVEGARAHEPALVEWSSLEQRVTRRTSFSELAFLAEQVERALRAHGVCAGDPIAVLSHPTLDYFVAIAGLLRLGAVAVNINWRQPLETMQYMAALGRSVRVVASAHFLANGAAGRLLPGAGPVLLLGNPGSLAAAVADAGSNGAVLMLAKPALPVPSRAASIDGPAHELGADVACVMFTSGSTGRPKGVPLTQAGLLWSCEAKLKAHGGRAGVARGTLSFLPNFHVMGFTNNFLFNVCIARCPAFVHRDCETVPLSLAVMSDACAALRPSLVDTVPHFLEALALCSSAHAPWERAASSEAVGAFAACDRVLFGGCALSSTAFETLTGLGLKLASQYGQTELAGMVLLGVSDALARPSATAPSILQHRPLSLRSLRRRAVVGRRCEWCQAAIGASKTANWCCSTAPPPAPTT
jgi:long-subunit acyl-CoA synthetase (AMP-forming)